VLRKLVTNSALEIVVESLDPYYVSSGMRRVLDSGYYRLHRTLNALLRVNRYDTIWMIARKP
jgi:hypothetical protein